MYFLVFHPGFTKKNLKTCVFLVFHLGFFPKITTKHTHKASVETPWLAGNATDVDPQATDPQAEGGVGRRKESVTEAKNSREKDRMGHLWKVLGHLMWYGLGHLLGKTVAKPYFC